MRVCSEHEVDRGGPCPVEITLNVVGGKWKAVILYHLQQAGTHRFAELRRKIPGVSERMLTQQLRQLEGDGIVQRKVYPEVPPKVEYSLTGYGASLQPIIEAMCAWGLKHLERTATTAKFERTALYRRAD